MISIRFGGYQGDHSVHTRAGRVFCESLRERLDNTVDVQFKENVTAQGRKAADLLSMTESGELDGCYFSSSYLAKRVRDLGLFDQHFVVPDRRLAYALLDGRLGTRLAEEVAQHTGYVVLGYWDNGLRHISSGRGSIRTPAACSGLKIRTLASDDHQRVFAALGFEPMAIDVRDLPDAVASFKVDAQENPLTNIYNFGLHKTHRHVTLTRHLLGVAPVLFNKERVAAWPETVRAGVDAALKEATAAQRRFAAEDDRICADKLRADGVELIELSDTERAAFVSATRNEVAKTRTAFSAELTALFDQELAKAADGVGR
ncbi:MAG: TRAP transporter substrate-binding protein [Geminicoccaceae bacterium]